jgi:hypothetical protein
MTRRDLVAALHHLDNLPAPLLDRHRLALERLLLCALLELDAREREQARRLPVLAN